MNPNDALVTLVTILVQIAAVIIVSTQAIQNAKYLTLHFGPWTIVNTLVTLFIAFNWDLRLIEGLTGRESLSGQWADNLLTGWVMSGGISSVYNMAKKAMQTKQQLSELKVEGVKVKVDNEKVS